MEPPALTPDIEPSLYHWRASTKKPNLYLRRALGAETIWARKASGPRQMFLNGSFTLIGPYSALSLDTFGKAAERAWLRVRSEFPEVALGPSSEQGEDGSNLLELKIPMSERETREWMRRSLFLGTCVEGKTAEEEMRQAVIRDPVCVRLNARVDQDSKVFGAEFAFRVDHLTADGVGAYIVTACFLNFLANAVGGREEAFDWEAWKETLPTPWVGMMNTNQRTEGKEFEEGVKKTTNLVMEASKSEWGMAVLSEDGYMPKAIHKRFSVKESNAILLAVKEKIGEACFVTQLGHAAMVMTMLKFKPVQERPTHGAQLVSPLFINGRRFLDQCFPPSQNYISMCRAISAISFRNVENYILSDNESKEEVQGKLKLACAEAFRSYQAVRDQKSVLTESFSVAEHIARAKNDLKAFKGKETADAFFLSDGIIEKYISNSYCDETQIHKVLEVDGLQFTANPDGPPLIIRMSTFRQAINLSAEWNGACYMDEDIRKFLDSVADLMLSLIT
ncbi:MAG: trichothecene 15-O-acetyltransferase [Alectoria fallacina]|uniref:Trichothecene 15-O-acetyltransferase n=1 Tax=Alectoria fallacina TaxID=1903189 RepID=A0A8H3G0H1_9LECA|nr:MAG: trichothecene 15-O-acetyltransferase [Alectoria fallacina]